MCTLRIHILDAAAVALSALKAMLSINNWVLLLKIFPQHFKCADWKFP